MGPGLTTVSLKYPSKEQCNNLPCPHIPWNLYGICFITKSHTLLQWDYRGEVKMAGTLFEF
jgi:hypothetical protein